MSSSTLPSSPPKGHMDRSGSFFKLIDTFALEIGELKQEMVRSSPEPDQEPMALQGLEGVVSGVYLQSPHSCGGAGGERDSGYDSLRRRMSVLDRLTQTHPVWLLLAFSEEEARRVLLKQPLGVFLVRKSTMLQKKVLSVRLNEDGSEPSIRNYLVKESQYTFSLEGSVISFADLFRLVAFYCISRDVLPFTLKLPEAIASAKTQKDLEEVAQLGAGFWDSALGKQLHTSPSPSRPLSRTLSLQRSNKRRGSRGRHKGTQQRQSGSGYDSAPPALWSHAPLASSPLESSQSSGAVCFVNPLFLQTHHHHQGGVDPPASDSAAKLADNPGNTEKLSVAQLSDIQGGERPLDKTKANGKSRPPPPRPPPPRSVRRPPPPVPSAKPKSVQETVAAVSEQHRSPPRRPVPSRPHMGAKHSSPSKMAGAPIPVPSNPPPRPKRPDLEAHRCHIALDDETIAKALSRAKLPPCQPPPPMTASLPLENDAGSPPIQAEKTPVQEGGRQRLSDMSMSTSSSDSLDSSQSPGFSLGLGSSPSRHHCDHREPAEDSSEEDEEDEEDEEEDDGVSLENDLDMRLRLPHKARRLRVGVSLSRGSFVLPRALKGQFRKVSGVLSSLMTPERRSVKRIAELSRDKSSYFGSLVQDYISFVQENRSCHTSGLDFLQTIRQFMTQMKAYLHQSSELDPPIESLIPEDQIDQVLEKAMHKAVLKPLKSAVEVALHDFQVSSGAWLQLRENLALARMKKPQELGVDGAVPPDAVAIEKIRQKFLNMRKTYSPEKKVLLLLRVCKLIYTIMQDNSGRMYGADDFLPMLTYVMAQCDMPQLDTEIEYMMELLDPSLLQGEGGYYLTSAYGAMALIRNFQEEQAAQVLSSEVRSTLHQWHQRRTAQRSAPSVDDFQVSRLT
ncbi:ras and Rab interactor 2-like isoform X2 [Lampris incognitus]|uniref:ras and Rab interactor 2-like isoform X2 n=1 Tax=Lampris incognitus TaxID=2546036 RepID=UPI0024B59387|nr:ras and Rab interactor 2-like isoform X2 [Lampris incognitus]